MTTVEPAPAPQAGRNLAAPRRLPIALDAMGGDHAPEQIVAGARIAAEEYGIPVLLVGRPEALGERGELPVLAADQVIAMDADPGASVRKLKDSSLVRAAEAVRDARAAAMVSAGNTGAAMASALLRMGRIGGVARPAIAIPIPCPTGPPTVMLDAGANAECAPEWLLQFAQMGAVVARRRFGVEAPRIGLLSIGEESVKGNTLVKEAHALLAGAAGAGDGPGLAGGVFVGNVEGRDLMSDRVDVVVTDGFTGNVALKALEGGLAAMIETLEQITAAADAAARVAPFLAPLRDRLDPEKTGGAMLLGVRGVCIISHGSSSARAVANACRVAQEMVDSGLVDHLTEAAGRSRAR
ncbi:MAG: phosphate acyltransferase PlsX [Acidimicrobiales bacterium]